MAAICTVTIFILANPGPISALNPAVPMAILGVIMSFKFFLGKLFMYSSSSGAYSSHVATSSAAADIISEFVLLLLGIRIGIYPHPGPKS